MVLIYSTEIYFLGYYCIRPISTQENFPQKKTFVKCDLSDTNFPWEKNFEVENVQLLTMTFSENFLYVENFLEGNGPLGFKCQQTQTVRPRIAIVRNFGFY